MGFWLFRFLLELLSFHKENHRLDTPVIILSTRPSGQTILAFTA
jgi:hypothetical protein